MILHFVALLVPLFAPSSLSASPVHWSVVTQSLYTDSATFMNMRVIHTGRPFYFGQSYPFCYLSNNDQLYLYRAFGEVELQNFNNLIVELRTLVATNRCAILLANFI